MNKAELVKAVAEATGMTQGAVANVLETAVQKIVTAAKQGAVVTVPGLGLLSIKKRLSRQGRNPLTGAEITIPAKTVPVFKIAKAVKDAVA